MASLGEVVRHRRARGTRGMAKVMGTERVTRETTGVTATRAMVTREMLVGPRLGPRSTRMATGPTGRGSNAEQPKGRACGSRKWRDGRALSST